jgi:serine/threonine protein kinase
MLDVMAVPRPGEVFAGKYLIERMVGSGKNSLVFVAQHSVTGKRFAIEWVAPKADYARHDALIDEDDTSTPADIACVSNVETSEVRDAAELVSEADDYDTSAQQVVGHFRHPNVLEVYDVGEAAGSLYTVMEWSEGESLEARIARTGPMSIADACQLLVPCMRGLHEAHSTGIVHRDLKPSNIFLCQASRSGAEVAKVLDFELASEGSGSGDTSAVVLWRGARVSKPYYRAPEQLGGLPVDRRADVYGFGAIMYEALTGRPPFAPVSYSNGSERTSRGNPALQSRSERLPRGADAIVGRAMARDVAKRFQTLHELADAFEALSSPGPYAPSPGPYPPEPSSASHEHFDSETAFEARTTFPPDGVYVPYPHGHFAGSSRMSGPTALLAVGALCFVGLIGFMAYEEWSSRRGEYLRSIELSSSVAPPHETPLASIAGVHVPQPAVEAPLPRGLDPELQAEPEAEQPTAAVETPPSREERPARATRPSSLRASPGQPSARVVERDPSIDRPRPPAQNLIPRPPAAAARDSRPSSPTPPQSNEPADLLPMHLM